MTIDSPLMLAYCVFVVALVGLCMGSFLNCLAWRLTHGESVLSGRSHCTTCGHVLGFRDLIPVLSWVASGGKCRYCGEKVSARYPITELVCGVAFVSVFLVYGLSLESLELMGFCGVLLVLTLTDLDECVIPNATIVAAIAIRVAYIAAMAVTGQTDAGALVRESLLGGLVGGVPVLVLSIVMDRVLGRDSMGGGDIKLLFVAGLYFGWTRTLFLILVACVAGIVFGMARASDEERAFPFGPAIAFACWVCMLAGSTVVESYMGLFGM